MQGLCNDHIKTARPPLKGASSRNHCLSSRFTYAYLVKMQAFNTLQRHSFLIRVMVELFIFITSALRFRITMLKLQVLG